MLSTGFVPESQFPDWIAPFARNQPVSQFANAMRAFNEDTSTASVILPAVWWCLGLFILGATLLYLGMRKAQR